MALVGRAEVRRYLTDAVGAAEAGHGGLVLLSGEPGIGKTALARWVGGYARDRGAVVAWGSAWPGDGAPAYWPWVQVLRDLGLSVAAPEPGTAPAAARFAYFDEVTSALLSRAPQRLLLVVQDDLHWSDEASLALLDFLARRLATARALVVGTSREALALPGDVLPLGPLSTVDTEALVGAILGRAPEPELVAEVARRAGGNPLFVEQVTRLGVAAPVPPGVRTVIEQRLAALSPECTQGLGLLAVGGEVTGAAGEAVAEAVRAGLLVATESGYRFGHDLVRETVEAGLDPGTRAKLHGAVGAALAERADVAPAVLAHHFRLAGEMPGEVLRYSVAAGREAGARLAYLDAVRHWAEALAVAGPDRRLALTLELADARRRAGQGAAAREEYDRTRDRQTRPMYDLTVDFARLAPPPPVALALFTALAQRPAEVERFYGVLTGTVPVREFFSPGNLRRLVGLRTLLPALLRRPG